MYIDQPSGKSPWTRAAAASLLLAGAVQAGASVTSPTIGSLLWSEEFNGTALDTQVWTPYNGDGCQIGLCGYGNAELESYSPNNLAIVNVPFEPGTRALAIQARREVAGNSQFTSGKIDSYNKVQVQYGMIEVRMAAPNVQTGLWPAAWLLGTTAQSWPTKGEIDVMEQGHKQASWSAAGAPSPNNFVGSNVITYQKAACVPGNESCAASTSWQTKSWYVAPSSLANRFVTYRLYWTDAQMRFTIVDNGVEHDMYDAPLPVNSTALQAPFYLLLNLAVGGNFTDAATPSQVTAPLPGTMYVDYVRVYQLDGKGTVKLGNQIVPETGKFGVFTDNTPVTHKLVAGTSSDIYLWNTASMAAGNIAPYEGSNDIAWAYTAPGQWFGGGIQSRDIKDMRAVAPARVARAKEASASGTDRWIVTAVPPSEVGPRACISGNSSTSISAESPMRSIAWGNRTVKADHPTPVSTESSAPAVVSTKVATFPVESAASQAAVPKSTQPLRPATSFSGEKDIWGFAHKALASGRTEDLLEARIATTNCLTQQAIAPQLKAAAAGASSPALHGAMQCAAGEA